MTASRVLRQSGWRSALRLRGTSGQSLIEGAIVLPMFVLIVTGIVEVGLAVRDQQIIARIAREGANLISRDVSLDAAATAITSMSTAPVDFNNGSRLILSVIKRGGAVGTANYDRLVLYQRLEIGTYAASSRLQTSGTGTFGPGPNYVALNSDSDVSLQVTNAPAGVVTVIGGLIYVSEVFTRHDLVTPLNTFGVIVPQQALLRRPGSDGPCSWMTPMKRRHMRTAGGDEGFALIFGVVVTVMLLLFAGLCLDAGRAYVVKTQLPQAVDGAALGAARMLNSADPRAEAAAIFKANFPQGFMGTGATDPTAAPGFYSVTTDEAAGVNIIQIRASTVMPTTFMNLANLTDVTVGAFGEATRRMVDLCLVLDTSGSLGWRYPYVRDAARAFIAAFDEDNDRFCLVRYGSGAPVLAPMTITRGYDKAGVIAAVPETFPSDPYTSMAEGLWRGWDGSEPSRMVSNPVSASSFCSPTARPTAYPASMPTIHRRGHSIPVTSPGTSRPGRHDQQHAEPYRHVAPADGRSQSAGVDDQELDQHRDLSGGAVDAVDEHPRVRPQRRHHDAIPAADRLLDRERVGAILRARPAKLQRGRRSLSSGHLEHEQCRPESRGDHRQRRAKRSERRLPHPRLLDRHGRAADNARGNDARAARAHHDARRERQDVA